MDAEGVARASLRAVPFLAVRQVIAQSANLVGGLVLARLLVPADFGVFAIAVFVHGVALAVAGPGLALGLAREPEEPREAELRTAFTLVQGMAFVVAVVAWIGAPLLAWLYGHPPGAVVVFRAIGIAVLIGSLQAVPAALLERRLDFRRLAMVEIAQLVAFHLVSIGLVLAGQGNASFGIGFIARACVGAGLAAALSPWDWGYSTSATAMRRTARFAAPFQGATAVSLIRDSLTPVMIGMTAGSAAVGFVVWAQTVATFPSMATMMVQRVLMPAFAQVQHQREALGHMVNDAIRLTHALTAPIAVLTLVLIDPIVAFGFGESWREAIPLFYLLWIGNLFAPTVTPLLALLNAVGESRLVLLASLMWAIATWTLGVPLVWWLGALGYGVAKIGVQLTNLAVFRMARAHAPFGWGRAMAPAWALAAVVGLGVVAVQRALPVTGVVTLVTYFAAGLGAYGALVFAVAPRRLRAIWGSMRGAS